MTAYGLPAGSTLSVSTPVHDCTAAANVCGDPSVDDYASITVSLPRPPTPPPRKIQFLFGGHLAWARRRSARLGLRPRLLEHQRWPVPHQVDGLRRCLDRQPRQPDHGLGDHLRDTGLTTQVKNTNGTGDGTTSTGDDTNIANGAHVSIGTTVYDTATLHRRNSDRRRHGDLLRREGRRHLHDRRRDPARHQDRHERHRAELRHDHSLSSAGTYYFWAVYSGDANNKREHQRLHHRGRGRRPERAHDLDPGQEATPIDSNIANNAHVAIGTTAYDTATPHGRDLRRRRHGRLLRREGRRDLLDRRRDVARHEDRHERRRCPTPTPTRFTSAGTYYFWAVYCGDANNSRRDQRLRHRDRGRRPELARRSRPRSRSDSDDSNVANGAHVAIGTVAYDTATLTGATADAGGTVDLLRREGRRDLLDRRRDLARHQDRHERHRARLRHLPRFERRRHLLLLGRLLRRRQQRPARPAAARPRSWSSTRTRPSISTQVKNDGSDRLEHRQRRQRRDRHHRLRHRDPHGRDVATPAARSTTTSRRATRAARSRARRRSAPRPSRTASCPTPTPTPSPPPAPTTSGPSTRGDANNDGRDQRLQHRGRGRRPERSRASAPRRTSCRMTMRP